jgi:hypothetical protein
MTTNQREEERRAISVDREALSALLVYLQMHAERDLRLTPFQDDPPTGDVECYSIYVSVESQVGDPFRFTAGITPEQFAKAATDCGIDHVLDRLSFTGAGQHISTKGESNG